MTNSVGVPNPRAVAAILLRFAEWMMEQEELAVGGEQLAVVSEEWAEMDL